MRTQRREPRDGGEIPENGDEPHGRRHRHVHEGRATLEVGTVGKDGCTAQDIHAGDCFRFLPRTIHRLEAHEDTLIVEVSTPEIEDVVRLEDDYGRAGTSAP